MSKLRAMHANCSVVGCPDQHKSLHRPPVSEDRRAEWINFIFDGNVPAIVGKNMYVCASHFVSDCFTNLGQYNAGLATKLFLKDESIPTVRYKTADEGNVLQGPLTATVGCQAYLTIPRRTVATQLSKGRLTYVRSQGCQAIPTFFTRSIGVGTDNQGLKRSHRGQAPKAPPAKQPCVAKQPWVAISFKDISLLTGPMKGSFKDISLLTGPKRDDSSASEKSSTFSQIDACRDQLSDCLPSLRASEKRTSSRFHLKDVSFSEHMDLSALEDVCVNLGCLLQLFRHCGRCRGVCAVSAEGDGKRFSVLGRCKDCSRQTTWSNQPFRVSSKSNNGKSPCSVQVSGEKINPPPDEGKGRMEPAESLTMTSTASNRHKGTGINKQQGKTDSERTEKPFVELDVTIDSDGEQSVDEDVYGLVEEEEEVVEEEMEGLGMEVEETGVGMSDSIVEDGQREEVEKENSGIEHVENGQEITWPEWDDWQTEEEEEEKEEEMEEEEEEEDEQTDEGDDDWEADEEEDVLDSDSDFDSESDCEQEKKRSNIKGGNKPRRRLKRTNRRPERLTPLLCPDCGVTYTTFAHSCCNNDALMVCSECGARCVSEVGFKLHKMDCKGRTYACKYCLKQLATWGDKLNHEEQSHPATEKDPYWCSECPQRFSNINERRRHFKQHKKIICQTCHKEFTTRGKLKRHMLSHSSDKPYKCKVCSRAFAQAGQLKCHTRVHTGERPYTCQLCPLSFNHNVSLKNHVWRHHQVEGQGDPDTDSLVTTATGVEKNEEL